MSQLNVYNFYMFAKKIVVGGNVGYTTYLPERFYV